jgi:hypothetical protein
MAGLKRGGPGPAFEKRGEVWLHQYQQEIWHKWENPADITHERCSYNIRETRIGWHEETA